METKSVICNELKDTRKEVTLIDEPTTDKYDLAVVAENRAEVVLSEEEILERKFNPYKLANTLNIKVEDAKLLKSWGKTYVFAEDTEGNIIELFHPAMCCSNLSITVTYDSKERYEEFLKHRDSFIYAAYTWVCGQTDNINHFVC